MTTTFKSPINSRIDATARAKQSTLPEPIFAKLVIDIDNNVSIRQPVVFDKTYQKAPFVTYSLICADDLFGLNHNLHSVSTSGFTISIENSIDSSRSVELQYKLEFPQ